jgi:hypothetical protein
MDEFAVQVLNALIKTEMTSSWIIDKRQEFIYMDRLEVLRSLSDFDSETLNIVCKEIGVSFNDMKGTLRVLKKI